MAIQRCCWAKMHLYKYKTQRAGHLWKRFLLRDFFSRRRRVLAKEFLSLLLDVRTAVLNRLLPGGRGLALIRFDGLSCRSWRIWEQKTTTKVKVETKIMSHRTFGRRYLRRTSTNSTYPPFCYFYSSCQLVPWPFPHLWSQSLTSQFFGISRTP